MKRHIIIYIFILLSTNSFSQESAVQHTWQDDFDAFSEVEDFDNENWQDVYDVLEHLSKNPIPINTATKEDLQQIPFLTEKQIEDIQYYIYRYGKIKSMNELIMIESLGYEARRLLLNFITIDEKKPISTVNLSNLLKYGKHELAFTARVPLYERKGDKEGYLGYKYRHSLRYDYNYGQRIRFGFVGSNSSGEPFFDRNTMGYDHYNYYFILKDIGAIKSLALGTYKVSFGMGLVVSNGMSFGKMASLTSLGRTNNNIRPHASQSESNYFNGVAATVEVMKGLRVSAFLSNRNLDGTLTKD
ncbi:MAG: helix-hairpin-helix domain-containing protein, partial [Prevotellaceae bacterium]|nr:helix-hairpin-helix domain-containing protein [Prevotellaceae bacterium]